MTTLNWSSIHYHIVHQDKRDISTRNTQWILKISKDKFESIEVRFILKGKALILCTLASLKAGSESGCWTLLQGAMFVYYSEDCFPTSVNNLIC